MSELCNTDACETIILYFHPILSYLKLHTFQDLDPNLGNPPKRELCNEGTK